MEYQIVEVVALIKTGKGLQCGNCYFQSQISVQGFLPQDSPCNKCEGDYYYKQKRLVPINKPEKLPVGSKSTDFQIKWGDNKFNYLYYVMPPMGTDIQEMLDYFDANGIKWKKEENK